MRSLCVALAIGLLVLLGWLPLSSPVYSNALKVREDEDTSEPDYFPVQVGYQWFYRATYPFQPERVDTILMEITGTEEIEGHEYFRFSDGKLLRRDQQDQIICHEEGEERILYKFDAEQWEWWIYSIGPEHEPGYGIRDTTTVHLGPRGVSVAVPAGTFENCIRFGMGHRSGLLVDGPCKGFWLAPGVGMVNFEESALEDVDIKWELIKLGGDLVPVHMDSWGEAKRRFMKEPFHGGTSLLHYEALLFRR